MGLFDRLFGKVSAGQSRTPAELADVLAMDTMNRVLPAIATGSHLQELRRETTYLLGSISFAAMVVHPRFDERSGEGFFNRYLNCINAYGIEADLWPNWSPPFPSMFFPERLERYLPLLGTSDPTDSAKLTAAFAAASSRLVQELDPEVIPPAGLADALTELACAHWDTTIDRLGE